MKAGESARKSIIENIFQKMEYNEDQMEDFSPILKWLRSKNFTLDSTIPGVSTVKKEKFDVLNNEVTVSLFDMAKLEEIVDGIPENEFPVDLSREEIDGRLLRLSKLTKGENNNILMAESIASQVPLWQIKEFDKLNFTSFKGEADKFQLSNNVQLMVFQLSQHGYSTTARLIELLEIILRNARKILLILDAKSVEDLPCLIPAVYLVEAINKSKIWNLTIDFVFGINCLEVLHQVKNVPAYFMSKASRMLMTDIKETLPVKGAITRSCSERKVNYIVESSADIPATVEAIGNDMWKSGTKINFRTRAAIFVHQSVQQDVIDAFASKLQSLKVGTKLENKSLDFIKRNSRSTEAYKSLFQKGVKTIPVEADGSEPTLIYNVGTSSKFMTSFGNRGLGHLLFLIPYRTVTELFSLANTEGDNIDVFVYCSNNQIVKQVATGIKGSTIMINQVMNQVHEYKCFREHFLNTWYLRSGKYLQATPREASTSSVTEIIKKAIEESQKNLRNWSSVPIAKKLECSLEYLENAKVLKVESDLVNFSKRMIIKYFLNEEKQSSFSDPMNWSKPVGIIGILVDENVSYLDVIIAICLTILKGNAVIVGGASNNIKKIFEHVETKIVQFVGISTVNQGIQQLGQVDMLWILQPVTVEPHNIVEVQVAPQDLAIQKIILCHIGSIVANKGIQLEIPKAVYL